MGAQYPAIKIHIYIMMFVQYAPLSLNGLRPTGILLYQAHYITLFLEQKKKIYNFFFSFRARCCCSLAFTQINKYICSFVHFSEQKIYDIYIYAFGIGQANAYPFHGIWKDDIGFGSMVVAHIDYRMAIKHK